MTDERELEVGDLRDRREVRQRVVRQLREHHRREHGDDDRRQHQHAAVGRRVLHRLGDDPAAGAGPVLDHDRLLQLVLHAVGDQPRGDVGRAAGGEADEQPHRLVDLGERGIAAANARARPSRQGRGRAFAGHAWRSALQGVKARTVRCEPGAPSAKVFRCPSRNLSSHGNRLVVGRRGPASSRHGAQRFAARAPAAQHVDALPRGRRGASARSGSTGCRSRRRRTRARSSGSPRSSLLLSLFGSGLKMSVGLSDGRWLLPLRLAVVSMLVTVALIAGAGVAWLGLPLGAAILLGGILAPTDPVLASDVQVAEPTDRDRLRFSLTGEAGLNDGTAFPFVLLGLGLLGLHDLGNSLWRWLADRRALGRRRRHRHRRGARHARRPLRPLPSPHAQGSGRPRQLPRPRPDRPRLRAREPRARLRLPRRVRGRRRLAAHRAARQRRRGHCGRARRRRPPRRRRGASARPTSPRRRTPIPTSRSPSRRRPTRSTRRPTWRTRC